jgi:type II secretory pathway pseudopilin PulG
MDIAAVVVSVFAFLAAALSALYARQQVRVAQSASRAQSLLAVLDYLQRPDIRDSRREVLTILNTLPASAWTETQRATASNASASYDLVGTLLKSGVVDKGPIIQNYGASIIRCHDVCAPMIQGFRANMPDALARSYWDDFDWLADEARKEFGHRFAE